MLLKLVSDVSSIKATLESNYSLGEIRVIDINHFDPEATLETYEIIQRHIDVATRINRRHIDEATRINMRSEYNPAVAARGKGDLHAAM